MEASSQMHAAEGQEATDTGKQEIPTQYNDSRDPGADQPDKMCKFGAIEKLTSRSVDYLPKQHFSEEENALGDCLRSLPTCMLSDCTWARTVCPAALTQWEGGCRHHSVKKGKKEEMLHWMELSGVYLRNLERKGTWFGQMGVGSCTKLLFWWAFKKNLIFTNTFLLMYIFFRLLLLVRSELEENIHFLTCSYRDKKSIS